MFEYDPFAPDPGPDREVKFLQPPTPSPYEVFAPGLPAPASGDPFQLTYADRPPLVSFREEVLNRIGMSGMTGELAERVARDPLFPVNPTADELSAHMIRAGYDRPDRWIAEQMHREWAHRHNRK